MASFPPSISLGSSLILSIYTVRTSPSSLIIVSAHLKTRVPSSCRFLRLFCFFISAFLSSIYSHPASSLALNFTTTTTVLCVRPLG
ncbi:hypothetical protein BKA57DRAFT_456741 [Linnemannia elongata]|nr:hypothetical protein BKA57DRAFT_456741 [Linnemannia elongata]